MWKRQLTKTTAVFKLNSTRGASLIEYAVFILIVLSALYVMKDVIQQGIFSKYRQSGESLSFGRQYDPKRTVVCRQDALSYNADGSANMGPLYDEDCYYARVMRKPMLVRGAWDTVRGGCPTCDAGIAADAAPCFACEQAIKNQCAVESSYCSK